MVLTEQLPAILKELRKQHPAAEIAVTSGTSEVLVDQILAGEVDVAFVSLPVDVRGIKTERLSQDQLVAIASPRHKLSKQRTISAYTLAGERLILGERGGNTRRLIDQFFAQAGVTLRVAMELSRQQAIKRMVEEDMGVGIVPLQSVKEEVEKGKLIRWWIEGAQINWELGIAQLSNGYDSPIMQKFVSLAHRNFGDATPKTKKPSRR